MNLVKWKKNWLIKRLDKIVVSIYNRLNNIKLKEDAEKDNRTIH